LMISSICFLHLISSFTTIYVSFNFLKSIRVCPRCLSRQSWQSQTYRLNLHISLQQNDIVLPWTAIPPCFWSPPFTQFHIDFICITSNYHLQEGPCQWCQLFVWSSTEIGPKPFKVNQFSMASGRWLMRFSVVHWRIFQLSTLKLNSEFWWWFQFSLPWAHFVAF
jgi:hypothetical protein